MDDPTLAGKPVIVGGRPNSRGVVSAASYEAREFGVRSAMPLVRAGRLCPDGVYLRVRMERYVEISERIFSVFREYTPLVQGLSLDEAFLDVRGSTRLFGSGPEIGRKIQRRIADEIGLPCSVGAAPVKFVAKIASDYDKPNGFTVVRADEVIAFLDDLPVERLWGVGEVTGERLRHFGIVRVGQIREAGEAFLSEKLGEGGVHLYHLSCGRDARRVTPDWQRKSVGHETTFYEDIGDRETLLGVLLDLTEEVTRRARQGGHQGRIVTIKIRYAPFETHTSRIRLDNATNTTEEVWAAARGLFSKHARVPPRKVRLLGVSISDLGAARDRQLSLFDQKRQERARRMDETVDDILTRMGRGAIRRAAGPGHRKSAGKRSKRTSEGEEPELR
jgi:DNA polymerase-4